MAGDFVERGGGGGGVQEFLLLVMDSPLGHHPYLPSPDQDLPTYIARWMGRSTVHCKKICIRDMRK